MNLIKFPPKPPVLPLVIKPMNFIHIHLADQGFYTDTIGTAATGILTCHTG